MERPRIRGINTSTVTTPHAATMGNLLGVGMVTSSIAMTKREFTAIQKLYGFVPEKPNAKPEPPPAPVQADFPNQWDFTQAKKRHVETLENLSKWTDPRPLLQAGADRNAVRHAESDGLRLLAWIARYIPQGEDPLKTLIQLASQAGFDVEPEDLGWANGEEETDEDEEGKEEVA